MAGTGDDRERILAEARAILDRYRGAGSPRRRALEMRLRHWVKKLFRIAGSLVTILIAAIAIAIIRGGVGLSGVLLMFLAMLAAVAIFAIYPRFRLPEPASLLHGDLRELVGKTQIWLDARRRMLPPAALPIVDRLCAQLEVLTVQVEGLDQRQAEAAEVRKLVGEHLPEVVRSYTAIPKQLRSQPRDAAAPDAQIVDGLGTISAEMDALTRQLADGAMDQLAIRTRYLDYRYGGSTEGSGEAGKGE